MKIQAQVIADSITEAGDRITTMIVTMPRIILAEFNTHRVFSRNTSSSRAIPFEKMVKSIHDDPFIPIAWQKDHKGMQGTGYLTDDGSDVYDDVTVAEMWWRKGLDYALVNAGYLNRHGVTKQLANRLLEPFMWTTVICTSTEWSNFWNLRCPIYEIDIDNLEILK